MTSPDAATHDLAAGGPSRGLVFVLALAVGLIAANIYYAQPLVGLIAPDLGLPEAAASLVVTLSQIGYAIGLILLVPLGDQVENRRLVLCCVAGAVLALAGAALAASGPVFLLLALVVGTGSTAVQMLVPIAAHLAPDASRGRLVGNVMAGLLLGILLARPAASLIANAFGWRAVFGVAAAANLVIAAILWRALPVRRPTPVASYGHLIASLWPILRDTPVLRRRIVYQGCMFGAFTLFWTAVPLHLAGPAFGMTQGGIALFALCGASGAAAAPVAGRLGDRGHSGRVTLLAMVLVLAAFGLAWSGAGSVIALAISAILLDAGVQMNQITGQRTLYALAPAMRSRVNGIYMATFFLAGALGSALASPLTTHLGWSGLALVGAAFPVVALAAFATERRTA